MKGIRPCPYCKGEVEVIKLNRKKETDPPIYRIECRQCRALVVKGEGFPNESKEEAQERIRQYEEVVGKIFSTPHSTRIRQTMAARKRDRDAKNGTWE